MACKFIAMLYNPSLSEANVLLLLSLWLYSFPLYAVLNSGHACFFFVLSSFVLRSCSSFFSVVRCSVIVVVQNDAKKMEKKEPKRSSKF